MAPSFDSGPEQLGQHIPGNVTKISEIKHILLQFLHLTEKVIEK
jgi:hypothetical protein